jgi:DDB1- and CUL4-associated factor 13
LEKAREYTRALNAVKLERMFAKPFVGDLSGHSDGVYCMAKHPKKLTTVISGSGDGGTFKIGQFFFHFFYSK